MANQLIDPLLNPVKFHSIAPSQLPQYCSRFMYDWQFRRTIQPWDERVCFFQPWMKDDAIRIQYVSNFSPITLNLYNSDGELMHSQVFDTKQQDELRPGYYIRQVDLDLASYPPGVYYLTRVAGGQTLYSEPFELLPQPDMTSEFPQEFNPTLYIEYSHFEPYGGIKFQSPFSPNIRVPGELRFKGPESKDTVLEDQLLSPTMIRSVPYNLYTLTIGLEIGVPPWFVDKINRILGCSTVKIDGRLFTKSPGAKFEQEAVDGYPMHAWSIEVRETLNRDYILNENDTTIPGIAAAGLLTDIKGFGMNDNSGNDYTEIISLQ